LLSIALQLPIEASIREIGFIDFLLENLLIFQTSCELLLDLRVPLGLDDAIDLVRVEVGNLIGGEETGEELQAIGIGGDGIHLL
jgi:hypothetical protein